MGSHLSEPIRDKESSSGFDERLSWGCSAMQGWRQSMEDAHIAISDLGDGGDCGSGVSLFGVFDGHGGREVACFCKEYVPGLVQRHLEQIQRASVQSSSAATGAGGSQISREKLFGVAMTRAYHGIDDMLFAPEHQEDLVKFKSQGQQKASGEGEAGQAGPPAGASGPKERIVHMLENSIQSDLQSAMTKGTLTKDERTKLMLKMSVLKQAESKGLGISDPSQGTGLAADPVGCTAVCVMISDTSIVCANAGDSRAILCRRGKAIALSQDHKPNNAKEKRRIEAAGGTVKETPVKNGPARVVYRVNGDLSLSRAIGDLRYKKQFALGPDNQIVTSTPEIHIETRTPDDEFIVLACDGVWDVKTSDQVCRFVREGLRKGQEIPSIIENLLDECICEDPKKTGGLGADNMTCIIVKLHPLPNGIVSMDLSQKGGSCLPFRCMRL
eukprot:gnl/TRDRNA2_/TRDRNA2_180746_c0_seq1.p1 gnl/TRDRNA2_/TRDRNA2_180746_c0~~gnl/TRDRNA2_/TRDRNA2_180746_c0_seq1.p1  ORF type:complete len:442 (-),score=65.17 gnl/TRDRNA2_/TRDRNA2_180746_c0_seq1:212-1537(-)